MRSSRHTARAGISAVLLAVTMLLTGCVTTAGGPPGELRRALQQADSAAYTVQASFRQLHDGRTLPATTQTACDDMLKQAQSAQQSASTVSVDTPTQHGVRAKVLTAIGSTASLIVSVQDYLSKTTDTSADRLIAELGANRHRLAVLSSELGGLE